MAAPKHARENTHAAAFRAAAGKWAKKAALIRAEEPPDDIHPWQRREFISANATKAEHCDAQAKRLTELAVALDGPPPG